MTALGIAILIIGTSVLFAALGVVFVRRSMHGHVGKGHNDVLVPLFLTAGTLYAVLLGFLVIAVWENYGAAKDNAAEEASTLTTLYRQTNGMPATEQQSLRTLIREYTEDVVSKEWPIQAQTGGASPLARKALGDMYRAFSTMKPAVASSSISVAFLQTLNNVADDRNRRTLQANEHLSPILWLGLLIGGIIVVGMTFLLYMEQTWPHVLGSGLMAALIGTLLFMTFLLNTPFSGPMALSAESFEHSLVVYHSVDQGN